MNKKSENISEDIGEHMKRRVTMKLMKTQTELLHKTISSRGPVLNQNSPFVTKNLEDMVLKQKA